MRLRECGGWLVAGAVVGALAACSWGPSPPAGGLEPLDPPAHPESLAPYLSPGPLLSWLEPVAEGHRLVYSRLQAGSWQPPEEVARSQAMFANWADVPAVGAGTGAVLRAHWLESLGEGTYAYGIRWQEKAPEAIGWRDRGWLHEDDLSEAEHGFVSWASTRAASWVFWLDGRSQSTTGAMTLRGGPVGADGVEGQVLDPQVCDCCPTDSAMIEKGPVVVYRDRSDDEIRDIASVRWTDEGWSPPIPVSDDGWQIAGCPVNGPAVAAAGSTVAVAWFTAPRGGAMVRMAFSEDGGRSYSPPILVDGENPLGRVDLELLSSGEAVVSWLSRPRDGQGSKAALSVRRVSPTGRAGPPLVLAETTAGRSSGIPRILASDGALLVSWVDDGRVPRLRGGRLLLKNLPRIPG